MLFEQDPETEAVVMIGEIGGPQEAEAAEWVKENMTKPVVGYRGRAHRAQGAAHGARGRDHLGGGRQRGGEGRDHEILRSDRGTERERARLDGGAGAFRRDGA